MAAALLGAAYVPTAAADTSSATGSVQVTDSDGSVAGWMSNGYIKAHPDEAASAGVSTVQIQSASKCDEDVCMQVIGESLRVKEWRTQAFGNVGCTSPKYRKNWGYLYDGYTICPDTDEPGVYYYNYRRPRTYSDGDILAVYWHKVHGEPQAQIIK
ncbi:hypothetical protein ACIBUY_04365 [Streptomyces sp. NPDC050085]|uniref:hypothetical protein n=1 Tax=Streptomyces sp. NPDC050085 TaxID=3365600 RepID=UPI0037B305DA